MVGLAGGNLSTAAISAKETQVGREFGQENLSPRKAEKEVFSEAGESPSNTKMGDPCEDVIGSKCSGGRCCGVVKGVCGRLSGLHVASIIGM